MKFLLFLLLIISVNTFGQSSNNVRYRIITENGLRGFVNEKGERVIEPQYLRVSDFSEGLAMAVVDSVWRYDTIRQWSLRGKAIGDVDTIVFYKYGYINSKNEFVIEPDFVFQKEYNSSFPNLDFNCSLAVCYDTTTKKYGYINKDGKLAISCQYDEVLTFSENKAQVKDSTNLWGFIDTKGNTIVKCQYENASYYKRGRAIVRSLEENLKPLYDDKGEYNGFQLPTFRQMILDENGNIIKNEEENLYSYSTYSDDGIAKVFFARWLLNKWIFVDLDGNEIRCNDKDWSKSPHCIYKLQDTSTVEFEKCSDFSEGYAAVSRNGEDWFYIDRDYNCYITEDPSDDEPFYEMAYPFYEGLAGVRRNGRWGYINRNFDYAIECKYDDCSRFVNGLAWVWERDEDLTVRSLINSKGEIVYQKSYYKIKPEEIDNIYSRKDKSLYGSYFIDIEQYRSHTGRKLVLISIVVVAGLIGIYLVNRKKY